MTEGKSFTGRVRKRTTSRGVVLADLLARVLITGGGIGTIVAVMGVCLFLVWVVLPLFQSAQVSKPQRIAAVWQKRGPLYAAVDEYQAMGWVLLADGTVKAFRLDTKEVFFEKRVFEGKRITSTAFLLKRPEAVIGFEDGSVELVRCHVATSFLEDADVPLAVRNELATLPPGAVATFGESVIQVTPKAQYRVQKLEIESITSETVSSTPIRRIGFVMRTAGPLIMVVAGTEAAPELKAIAGEETDDFLTGGKTISLGRAVSLPFEALAPGFPGFLAVSGSGRDMYVAWAEGAVYRLSCGELDKAFVAEKGRLVEPGASLTAMEFILGSTTLVWGDSTGTTRGGFLVRIEELKGQGFYNVTRDKGHARFAFVFAKDLTQPGSAVTCLAPSGRTRLLLGGYANGDVRIFDVTSAATLATLHLPGGKPALRLKVAPKEDGLLAVTADAMYHCRLDPKHPEATFSSLFEAVWYEGYPEPQHMWQSSAAEDSFEPKFGLMPLIFGTLKATIYAMLFGAPLALLAALYSSEFLERRTRARVKPTIELMASLPSVVLGFLAALVFAPFVQEWLMSTLTVMLTIPFCLILGAYLWQLLPGETTRRLERWRLSFLVIPLGSGVFLAMLLGPVCEGVLFAGSLPDWLSWNPTMQGNDEFRSAVGGWFLLLTPLSVICAFFILNRFVNPLVRKRAGGKGRRHMARVELVKFGSAVLVCGLFSLILAAVLDAGGLDPRGELLFWSTNWSPLGTYVQRNALIVGFVMGFAIIPIIYTIADDALTAVPQHLRSASLGAGATPWQTVVRIIIPTAMSGLFSALMVGLGRAVGETMVVLMALGNTAIMDWNIFNGARTLSANIAVEMPEAVRDSTHYKTLFLAALVLFTMTFIVNTIAEAVRLRFRKRAYQL